MKLLMVTSNVESGAGSAFLRLHAELRSRGIDADLMYFRGKDSLSQHCFRHPLSMIPGRDKLFQVIRRKLNRRFKSNEAGFRTFDIGVRGFADLINNSVYDLVHLGWVSDSITSSEISRISKPLTMTMFDMNLVLGTYHYSSLEMFKSLNGIINIETRWIERYIFQRKYDNLVKLAPTTSITTPSRMLASLASMSRTLGRLQVFQTSNLTPVSFYPRDPDPMVIDRYGINVQTKNVLFIARDRRDRRKGAEWVEAWAPGISNIPQVRLIRIGRCGRAPSSSSVFHDIDYVDGEEDLCSIINACSLVLIPSLIDNIPQTALESLACGVPILTLESNGVDELVFDERLGHIIKDPQAFRMVSDLIKNRPLLSLTTRKSNSALFAARFNNHNVVNAYLEAYRHAMKNDS